MNFISHWGSSGTVAAQQEGSGLQGFLFCSLHAIIPMPEKTLSGFTAFLPQFKKNMQVRERWQLHGPVVSVPRAHVSTVMNW